MDATTVGRLIDVAIVAIVLEIIGLLAYRAKTGRGLSPTDVLGQLLAGAFLIAAVRTAVAGLDLRITLRVVSASLPVHLFDLVRRFRQTQRDQAGD